jgi:hypothetical protein
MVLSVKWQTHGLAKAFSTYYVNDLAFPVPRVHANKVNAAVALSLLTMLLCVVV